MKANTKLKLKSAISIATLSLLLGISNVAVAQTTISGGGNISSSIVVPDYSASQLQAANCDPNVWNGMVNDYKQKALSYNALAEKALVANQMQGAPSPFANCFDQAASAINSAMSAFNTIKSILTGGGMDSSQLLDYAKKVAVGAACSQVNNYLASSGLTSSINGGIGTVNQGIGTVLGTGTTIGGQGVNVGSVISGGGGSLNSGGANINGNNLANGATNILNNTGVLNSINPFK